MANPATEDAKEHPKSILFKLTSANGCLDAFIPTSGPTFLGPHTMSSRGRVTSVPVDSPTQHPSLASQFYRCQRGFCKICMQYRRPSRKEIQPWRGLEPNASMAFGMRPLIGCPSPDSLGRSRKAWRARWFPQTPDYPWKSGQRVGETESGGDHQGPPCVRRPTSEPRGDRVYCLNRRVSVPVARRGRAYPLKCVTDKRRLELENREICPQRLGGIRRAFRHERGIVLEFPRIADQKGDAESRTTCRAPPYQPMTMFDSITLRDRSRSVPVCCM